MKTTIIDNFSEGKSIKCFCNTCKKEMNHIIVKSIKVEWDENEEYGADGYTDYQIIKCAGCDKYTFREHFYCSEFRDFDSDGTGENLYPNSEEKSRAVIDFDELPYNLQTIYKESINCFNRNEYILCATGIRSILEGICNNQKITKGEVEYKNKEGVLLRKNSKYLDGKINGLIEKEIITKKQAKALHELRFLGNNAVHELDIPTRSNLITAFDIIEHIMKDIYELPIKSEKLERTRNKKKT